MYRNRTAVVCTVWFSVGTTKLLSERVQIYAHSNSVSEYPSLIPSPTVVGFISLLNIDHSDWC